MGSSTCGKNVYELAQERLKIVFEDFDNVCVSFRVERTVVSCSTFVSTIFVGTI